MANEITLAITFQFQNGTISAKSLNLAQRNFSVAGSEFMQGSQTIPTTAGGTALNLGNVTNPGFTVIKNLDPTNYIQVMSAVSGDILHKILPGMAVAFYFDASHTAPAVIAHTASCQIEYIVCPV